MATAQQLRAAASEVPTQGSHLPSYYNPTAVNANKIMDQVCYRLIAYHFQVFLWHETVIWETFLWKQCVQSFLSFIFQL